MQHREVMCRFRNGTATLGSYCNHTRRPEDEQECYNNLCQGIWQTEPWSPVSFYSTPEIIIHTPMIFKIPIDTCLIIFFVFIFTVQITLQLRGTETEDFKVRLVREFPASGECMSKLSPTSGAESMSGVSVLKT